MDKAVSRKPSKRRAEGDTRPYHHGDLAPVLRQSAREILMEKGLEGLTLRSVAKRAGVSHAAPYRHYKSREALLADIARAGMEQLREDIVQAAAAPGPLSERIAHVGAAYARFAARDGDLLRLMFGSELAKRDTFPDLVQTADEFGQEMGRAFGDQALGLAVWAAAHGIAMLLLDNVIDVGQKQSGIEVIPSRAEILLRSLFAFTDG